MDEARLIWGTLQGLPNRLIKEVNGEHRVSTSRDLSESRVLLGHLGKPLTCTSVFVSS